MNGSSEVVDLVANTPCAIGYSGLAYATEEVEMPCVSSTEGGDCVSPSVETAIDGTYPIARPLLMYTAGEAKRYCQRIHGLDFHGRSSVHHTR